MPFTVSYNGNGSDSGAVPSDPHGPYSPGETVLIPTVMSMSLSKTGAAFAYWTTKPDGSGTVHGWPADTSFAMPASDVVLYAQWFVTTGLSAGGLTAHYAFAYDAALQAGRLEPGRTQALMNKAEADFGIMSRWFAGVTPSGPSPIPVYVTRLTGGANNTGSIRLKPNTTDVDELRSYLVSEITESFMSGQNKGWGFLPGTTNEESCGEGLSLFLTQQFELTQGIAGPYTAFTADGWLNSSLPRSDPSSTRYVTNADGSETDFGSRFDYVNSLLPYPGNGPGTGCSILFIYYLNQQLGFPISQIIAAAPGYANGVLNASAPLRGVYENLTGDKRDPFPIFKGLVDSAYSSTTRSKIPGPNEDNPFPIIDLLTVAWKGAGDDGRLFFTSSTDGQHFNDQQVLQGAGGTSAAPTATVFNGRLFVAWKGAGDDARLFFTSSTDGQHFNDQQVLQGAGGTSAAPTATVFNGRLFVAWKGAGDDARLFFTSSTDGQHFNDQQVLQGAGGTSAATAVVARRVA